MSAVGSLPPGYDYIVVEALQRSIGRGQSITVTATDGSSELSVSGSAAVLFDTKRVGQQPTNVASVNRGADTVRLSPAAQAVMDSSRIALDVIADARAANQHEQSSADPGTGQRQATQTHQSGAQQLTAADALADPTSFFDSFTLATAAEWQASSAAVTTFQTLLAQGEQASASDRFYADYTGSSLLSIDMVTEEMSDSDKASFMAAFTSQTLVITGQADAGSGLSGGTNTVTLTAQGEALGGTGAGVPPSDGDGTNSILVWQGLFGWARVSWSESASTA